jgi:hypothetical protein
MLPNDVPIAIWDALYNMPKLAGDRVAKPPGFVHH